MKHEVVVLRLKNQRVQERIQTVSRLWPKKKEFIEGAYKIFLFTKGQRKYAQQTLGVFREDAGKAPEGNIICTQYFDYPIAFQKVMKLWYEKRIQEE